MPPQIRNAGSPQEEQDVRDGIRAALDHLTTQITDADLQSCIHEKLDSDDTVITVGGEDCVSHVLAYISWIRLGPFVIHKSREIHLCLSNIRRGGHHIGPEIMHELAHVCCWPDGGGKGVPFGGADFRLP